MRSNFNLFAALIVGGALCMNAKATTAAEFPSRTVQIVVGAEPGGGTDFLARLLASKLSEKWGESVVVVNKPGAKNTIGASIVAESPPDGHVLSFTPSNFTITASTMTDSLRYDPKSSFEPIVYVGEFAGLFVINPDIPANSLSELVEYVTARPGELNFASQGPGSPIYVEVMTIAKATGMDIVGVNYTGSGNTMRAVVGGEVSMAIGSIAASLELVRAGKLKALAVSTGKRVKVLPEIPTVAESLNLPDYDFANWYGMLAPAGTPQEIITMIHADVVDVMNLPDIQQRLDAQGFTTNLRSPEEFKAFIAKDIVRWSDAYQKLK